MSFRLRTLSADQYLNQRPAIDMRVPCPSSTLIFAAHGAYINQEELQKFDCVFSNDLKSSIVIFIVCFFIDVPSVWDLI